MRKSDFVVASLLIVTMVSTAQGQSIAERLKKAIKVSVKKPDSAAKSDPANQRPVDQVSVAMPESDPAKWPLVPDILGIRIGMSVDQVRAILQARPLGNYYELKSHFQPPADTTSFVDLIVNYRPEDPRNQSAGGEDITVYLTPPPGPGRVVNVIRRVFFATDKVPRDVDFRQALTTKYGNRSAEDPIKPEVGVWLYPAPRTQSTYEQIAMISKCPGWGGAAFTGVALTQYRGRPGNPVLEIPPNLSRDCGDQIVRLEARAPDRRVPPDERLVTWYEIHLTGNALGFTAQRETNALMAAAKADAAKKKLERAKGAAKADTL